MTSGRPEDTAGDALASQVRRLGALPPARVEALLVEARGHPGGPAARTLAEHHLAIALEAAAGRPAQGLTVEDLFQAGALAVVRGVDDYARGGGPAAGLGTHLRQAVSRELDAVVAEAEAQRRDDGLLARDAERVEAASLTLRRDLGRPPTSAEVAASLSLPVERVVVVEGLIELARERADGEIALYLDDEPG